MKKLIVPLLALAFFMACEKDKDLPNAREILIDSLYFNDNLVLNNGTISDIDFSRITIRIRFHAPVDTTQFRKSKLFISGGVDSSYRWSFNKDRLSLNLFITDLKGLSSYRFLFDQGHNLGGIIYKSFSFVFRTRLDESQKFPTITDEELLNLVEQKTFDYFLNYGHPVSGLARERYGSGDIVTTGGSGFGLMAILTGIKRGFVTRQEGFERLNKIVNFLIAPTTNRFHGALPHWMYGNSGTVCPFSTKDDGGDLVETAFMMQGLLTVKEYFKNGSNSEKALCDSIQKLWEGVEWDWYRNGGQNRLYWHWSPTYNWMMNMPVTGWNEALIVYVLAASSPTHTIPKIVYDEGWAQNGALANGKKFYNITLPLGSDYGGPLFFEHYSFLGLDPRNLADAHANYWTQATAHALINYEYCVANPRKYPAYDTNCWGLTASDIPNSYSASSPTNDLGVIAPTAAISSLPYTPDESMNALRFFYYVLGDKLWGEYGFYDAFSIKDQWFATSYLAIDQGPIICMIENYRSGFLWDLFMSNDEIKAGLTKLGFTY